MAPVSHEIICNCGDTFTRTSDHTKHLQAGCNAEKESNRKASQNLAARVKAKRVLKDQLRKRRAEAAQQGLHQGEAGSSYQQDVEMDEADVGEVAFEPDIARGASDVEGGSEGLTGGNSEPVIQGDVQMQPAEEEPNAGGLRRSGRSNRGRMPARYRDDPPEGVRPEMTISAPAPVEQHATDTSQADMPEGGETETDEPPQLYRTLPNRFGLYREYVDKPLVIPDAYLLPEDFLDVVPPASADNSGPAANVDAEASSKPVRGPFWPYPNMSSFLYDEHYWRDPQSAKTYPDEEQLAKVLNSPGFRNEDLLGISFKKIHKEIEQMKPEGEDFVYGPGWHDAILSIKVPLGKKGTEMYHVPGMRYRKLRDVAVDIMENDPNAERFHYTPFKLFKLPKDSGGEPERIYDELISSDAFIDAHKQIMAQEPEIDGPLPLPRAIFAIMLSSDATHAAQFGNAKLWPGYLGSGNQAKRERARPSTNSCHHFAHFPDLPDDLQDKIRRWTDAAGSRALFTHCRRELFHAAWEVLLDPEFLHAYQHGIVVHCRDGVTRRIYLRIFTYSADYPEKILIATIRDLGGCPCPRCLMTLDAVVDMGKPSDIRFRTAHPRVDTHQRRFNVQKARENILKNGYVVNTKSNDPLLKEHSYVPTENAFSRLAPFGFNLFLMLVVDLMHEFELGVWKALLIHLLRILECVGPDAVAEFDARFRQVPTFGRDTIRRFSTNVSDLKKLAARDYEDILQCSIPCIEGLIPEPHNTLILNLLFTCALWHGLAKLRLHSESTLTMLEQVTSELGDRMREFVSVTCAAFQTRETSREYQARLRRVAALAKAGKQSTAGSDGRRFKTLNTKTYKWHAVADYPRIIRMFGTTDSYTTHIGEHAHKTTKAYFARGSKNRYVRQVTKMERRSQRLRRIREKYGGVLPPLKKSRRKNEVSEETLAFSDGKERYHIAKDSKHHEKIGLWELTGRPDPAKRNFSRRLRDHLLARLLNRNPYSDKHPFTDADRQALTITRGELYWHQVFRPNYTTYDIYRAQSSINPNTPHCDIMMASGEDDPAAHPYWYARVVRIFHVNVVHHASGVRDPLRMDVLFVRWFGVDPEWQGGWKESRLDRIGFVPQDDPDAFGFVDPAQVIRGCHLIPAFAVGETDELLSGSSVAREGLTDWENYYVMRFVDRDILMRYVGGAPGHTTDHKQSTDYELHAESPDAPRQDNVEGGVALGETGADAARTRGEETASTFEQEPEAKEVEGESSAARQGEEEEETCEDEEGSGYDEDADLDFDDDEEDDRDSEDDEEMPEEEEDTDDFATYDY